MSKKKYVIESAFKNMDVQKIMQLGVDANGRIAHWTDSIGNIEELNSDYINEHFGELQDEAYKRGYEEGRKVGSKDGMYEAWEAAKKIALMDIETSENVTGYFGLFRIMKNLTPMQAIEKLKAYEEKQKADDEIKVGDEVVTRGLIPGNTFLVTKVTESSVYGISNDGSWNFYNKDSVTKTGKHYDIASILEAMRE